MAILYYGYDEAMRGGDGKAYVDGRGDLQEVTFEVCGEERVFFDCEGHGFNEEVVGGEFCFEFAADLAAGFVRGCSR